MQVKEKDNQLIVQTRLRSLFSILIFGLIFAGAGLAAFWFFGRHAAVECTRLEAREVRCEIKETLLGLVIRNKTVVNPQEARVQVNEDSDGDTYRVALVTAQGVIPLTDVWSGDGAFTQTETQLNQFLKNPAAKAVSVSQPPSPWVYLFPLCFCGVGLFMILAVSFETYTFDRDRAVLLIKRQSLRGTRVSEEPLSGLNLTVRDHSDSDSTSYRVHVHTNAGRDITLGNYGNQRSAQQLVQRIEDFIKPGVRIRYVEEND